MTGNGTFVITRERHAQLLRDILTGRKRIENEPMKATSSDPDCFEENGDPRAAARWSDDGGRTP